MGGQQAELLGGGASGGRGGGEGGAGIRPRFPSQVEGPVPENSRLAQAPHGWHPALTGAVSGRRKSGTRPLPLSRVNLPASANVPDVCVVSAGYM